MPLSIVASQSIALDGDVHADLNTIDEEEDIFKEPETEVSAPVFLCHICGSSWDNQRKRNGHMSSCKRRAKSSSTKDDSNGQASSTLDVVQSQPLSEFACEVCGKVFPTSRGVTSHKGRVHKKTSLSLPL